MNDAEMMLHHKDRVATTASEKLPRVEKISVGGPAGMPAGMFTKRERDRECRWCGQTFTQYELSPAFNRWVESLPVGAREAWKETVTENALPLFCVRCERRELARMDAIVPARRESAA